MSKHRNKKPQRTQRHARLADHQRQGKLLRPPLLAAVGDKMRGISWAQAQLPDFLWVCWHLIRDDPHDLVLLSKRMDSIEGAIGSNRADYPERWLLDGRLTTFESMPSEARLRVLDYLHDEDMYEVLVPEDFAHVLGMYPSAPGRWLIEPWLHGGLSIDPGIAQRQLASVVTASIDGGGRVASRAKAVPFRSVVKAGRMHFPPELAENLIEKFVRYPLRTTHDETAQVESVIRSSFGAMVGLLEVEGARDSVESWARTFWRSNWKLYACERREPLTNTDPPTDEQRKAAYDAVTELQSDVRQLRDKFLRLADTTDPDVYDPDRFEVLTGLVARVLRYLQISVGYPPLWTMEHGAPLLRAVVETLVIVRYLSRENSEPDLFRKFKAYGMGRLKLLKLHFEEYLAAESDPHEDMIQYVKYLEALVNQDTMEEFQDINLGGNFVGKDMRKLAAEVNLEREYRLLFAPASSNVHGEWSVIDEYALERCGNPLHRGHRIVRHDVSTPIGSMVVETVVGFAHQLVDDYEAATSGQREAFGTPLTDS